MEHRGEILERAVRGKDFSITKLAARLKKSRPHIYHLFARPNINPDYMLKIGKIIDHDFRPELEIFNLKEPLELYDQAQKEADRWKNKYFDVVEENARLKKRVSVLEKAINTSSSSQKE